MAQRISQLKGVGLVSISGGQRPAVRVQANPDRARLLRTQSRNLRTALGSANVNQAKGNFDGAEPGLDHQRQRSASVRREYKPDHHCLPQWRAVRMSDVATIIDGAEDIKQAAWINDTPAVVINIQRQPGTNIIGVVDTLKPCCRRSRLFAAGRHGARLTDRTTTIRASVEDVEFELMLTIALVVMVIFLFLRSFRRRLSPALRCRSPSSVPSA